MVRAGRSAETGEAIVALPNTLALLDEDTLAGRIMAPPNTLLVLCRDKCPNPLPCTVLTYPLKTGFS